MKAGPDAGVDRVPDAIQPLRGYRCFDLRSDVLRAVTRDVAWLPGVNVAGCDVRHGLRFEECRFIEWYTEGPPLVMVDPGLAGRMKGCVIEFDGYADTAELMLEQNGVIEGRHLIASAMRVRMKPGGRPEPPAGHPVPAPDCSCGFYAVTESESLPIPDGAVPAVVEGWGRVQLHEEGWRAEYAKVVALVGRDWRERRRLRRVADRYGVPIMSWKDAA